VAIRTLIVNTMPAGDAYDFAGHSAIRESDPPDRPDLYLDYETGRGFQRPKRISRPRNAGDIPEGMEGFYYLP
jgi:hypothetical protein